MFLKSCHAHKSVCVRLPHIEFFLLKISSFCYIQSEIERNGIPDGLKSVVNLSGVNIMSPVR